ncbi:MAG: 2-hydroxyacyl-CoA dehydratase, partial [Deltaproteobacteria bacterium]|nr:2-hydroxyacyl-CoA dehydratase [Deltaproteobacteria bacterium]
AERGEFRGDRSRKGLECTRMVNQFHKEYHAEVKARAATGEPVVWTNVGVPQEVMHAMDLPILFHPNWAAILAAKQTSPHYLNVVNERGYFRDLCKYCAVPLGYFFEDRPEDSPWGGVPKPSAFVVDVADDPIVRICELMAKELGVPLYLWDKTMIEKPPEPGFWDTVESIEEYSYREEWRLDYAVRETEGMIGFLETVTGKSLSLAKLREVVERSNEQFDYIGRAMDLSAHVPAPVAAGDLMANLISTQFFRGHEFGLAQARRLYAELRDRVERGVAACPNERIRLMYMFVPNWFSPGFFNAFEDDYGAVFVWMGYLNIIPRQLIRRNVSDPLRALAARYVHYTEFGAPPFWPEMVAYDAKKFRIDGVVYQTAESCKLLCGPLLLTIKAMEKLGIPTCHLVADMVDCRDWDDAKMKAQVASFIETLG